MSKNLGRIIPPLNWPALVEEALRRRKAERLTQKEHAELAGVSVPTMVAFDRGEETLTLAKAFDILRVVGLIERRSEEGAQGHFVQEAIRRWRELTSALPENSQGRFPHGWFRFDYALKGDLKSVSLTQFEELMQRAKVRHTGWPLFIFLQRGDAQPREVDGVIECWVQPEDKVNRMFADAAHCDFWRAAPSGRAVSIRGYQEDGSEVFPPGTVLDTTLPMWRLGEGLLHARNLARLMAENPAEVRVQFRALYTGLAGRVLRSWANPLADLLVEGNGARSDEAALETTVSVREIEENLTGCVHPLIVSLFERFGVTGLSLDRVKVELDRMQKNNF